MKTPAVISARLLTLALTFCTPIAQPSLPATYDLRDYDILTPVKHQMECGSCGEFAAVALLEALIKRETGREVDLSEQQIVSCVPGCGCVSGCSSLDALQYMRREGVVLEEDFPYKNADSDCIEDLMPTFYVAEVYSTVINRKTLADRLVAIKEAILKYGPVATNMALYADLGLYKERIYSYDGQAEALGGHWVCIVGWKDDPEMASGGYWICRNSWGEKWGDKGYFLSAYGDVTGIDDFYFVTATFDPRGLRDSRSMADD